MARIIKTRPSRRRPRGKSTFSCGHPRTPENTRKASGRGYTWGKCRICDNNYMRAYMRRRARKRLIRRVADAARRQAAKHGDPGQDR